ncbi:prolipoprotein diacylglyceryl transferase [Mycoplasma nasistruthionis]|uniref:Phosphatidylglycerol--prolipoprotein diacylglyceryl transferase n=1 Tax=Mycoplasma nasistruthionis TaxID=353852 RepID=A0A4Y6I7F9_9MOLU|nr:prolipoprotein diacylglyceryl transferase [Mycoplasma nasistruthionis]QCZ36902.1 prolipoprotein diacylglyceryl transferase [Mycoplasma nasistruthionis]QDF65177.1 prolipoprotein diacylglyceryl transferase [Mycoplasma nasistruthionis]
MGTSQPVFPSYVPDVAIKEGTSTILFSVGSYQMHLYSLMIMFGFIFSILTVLFYWHRNKWDSNVLMILIMITVPAGIFGGRLGFVIERLIYNPENPFPGSAWYKIWEGGMSIQGGVILAGSLDAFYLWTQRSKIDLRKAFNIILPAVLVGQFVGRFGNYANHEVYGRIDWSGASALAFGKTFADNMFISDAATDALGLNGAYRYPLFLYEGLSNLAGYILLCWVFNFFGLFKPGAIGPMYLIWYGLTRASMEPLREESFGLYSSVAWIFMGLGALMFIYFQFFARFKYIRTWQKYRFVYEYADPEYYDNYVRNSSPKMLAIRLSKFVSKLYYEGKTLLIKK